jgi:hypothetical protein
MTRAASHIGVSASKFDERVADGRMPQPKRIDGRKVWDVKALDRAFDGLPEDGEPSGMAKFAEDQSRDQSVPLSRSNGESGHFRLLNH